MNHDSEIFAHPARVLNVQDIDALTTLALQSHTLDPEAFAEHAPYFFRAEISSDRLDSYFTRMHESSLKNYAKNAQDGVSFQNSHKHYELGFGRSLTGTYEVSGDVQRVLADFYTVRGLKLNDVDTDHLILGIRTGLVKDVSIGFAGGEFRCSICGRDLWDWDCEHVPGLKYTSVNAKGNAEEIVLATAWVHDAELSEVSSVFDGATPGAAIIKAQTEAEAGRLNARQIALLESRYRVALPGKRVIGRGFQFEEDHMTLNRDEQPDVEVVEQEAPEIDERVTIFERVKTALADLTGENVEAKLAGLLADRTASKQRVRVLETELAELKPLAADGKQYRADLVKDALAEGVRAYGDDFDSETYTILLKTADLTVVKRLLTDWRAIGESRLPSGRKTAETHDLPDSKSDSTVPDVAFRA